MPDIPDPQTFKQIVDYLGYSLTGLLGAVAAWRRIHGSARKRAGGPKPMSLQRLERVERDIEELRKRQDDLHEDSMTRQNVVLKQQTAIFDLLVQQRNAIDKILAKMGGLS